MKIIGQLQQKGSTTFEWIKCLFVPDYARNTKLRITKQDEMRAFKIAYIIVGLLFFSLMVQYYHIYVRRQYLNQLIQYQEVIIKTQKGQKFQVHLL